MILAIKPLPHDLRAIDWSPDGRFLVAGLVNGVIILLDSNTLATLSTL
jgi:microtubule-associated protein-like 6